MNKVWSEHRLISFDETPIFYRHLRTNGPVRAVVILVHGMGEHGGRYQAFSDYLAELGIECLVPDLRGFGKSGGKKACVKRFGDFHEDLDALHSWASRHYTAVPIFLIGHSFGGLVVSSYLAFHKHPEIHGFVLSSPIFGVSIPVPFWRHLLGISVSYLCSHYTQSTRVEPRFLTHDPAILEIYRQDPLIYHKISARLYRELVKMVRRKTEIARRISASALIVQAGEDKVVSKDETVKFFDELKSKDKEIEIYADFYHEVLNETSRELVYSRIGRWLLERCSHK